MKFFQVARRVMLFVLVNMLVMLTLVVIASLLFGRAAAQFGYGNLLLWCLVIGMGGAFISLALSRWMAKSMMGVVVIDPNTASPDEQRLVEMVHQLARGAGLPAMPEVGIYDSPEINAFATGPSQSRALVAVSSGLLRHMRPPDIEGVLGHEITHVANGDMVTMALIQGVVNAFAMFLAEVASVAVTQGSRNDSRGGNFFMRWMIYNLFYNVFAMLGTIVICWFSRWREFRADAGGARLAGRSNMISALRALKAIHEAGADQAGQQQPAFQSLKISGKTAGVLGLLFADHPPLDERIARLENPTLG